MADRETAAGKLLYPGIVSRGDIIRPYFQTALQQRLPFHIPVAGDTGIRRPSGQIFRCKIVDDGFFKVRPEIHYIIGDIQLGGHPAGVFHSGKAAAASVFLLNFLFFLLPDLHGYPDDLIALFL